nr:hypothetical protein [uncultured Cupriavidus sp.]
MSRSNPSPWLHSSTLRSLGAGLAQLAPLAVAMAASALPFWFHTLGR